MLNVQIIWITWIGEHNIIKYLSFWITSTHGHKDTHVSRQGVILSHTHIYAHRDPFSCFPRGKKGLLESFSPGCLSNSAYVEVLLYTGGLFISFHAKRGRYFRSRKAYLYSFKKRLSIIYPGWHTKLDKVLCDAVINQISFWTRI